MLLDYAKSVQIRGASLIVKRSAEIGGVSNRLADSFVHAEIDVNMRLDAPQKILEVFECWVEQNSF